MNSMADNFTLEVKLIANEFYSRSNTGQAPFTMCLIRSIPMTETLSKHVPTTADRGRGEPQHHSQEASPICFPPIISS